MSSSMLEFNSCCFFVPLRVGCLILGYLNLVADVVLVIVSIIWLSFGIALVNDGGAALIAVGAILLIIVAVLLAFTITLLVGLHKERRGHVRAYLIYATIFLVLYTIMFIVNCATAMGAAVGYIIGTIIQILLYVYFLLVIRSHYIKMGESNYVGA